MIQCADLRTGVQLAGYPQDSKKMPPLLQIQQDSIFIHLIVDLDPGIKLCQNSDISGSRIEFYECQFCLPHARFIFRPKHQVCIAIYCIHHTCLILTTFIWSEYLEQIYYLNSIYVKHNHTILYSTYIDIYHCDKAFLTDVTSEDSCALGGFVFGDTFW